MIQPNLQTYLNDMAQTRLFIKIQEAVLKDSGNISPSTLTRRLTTAYPKTDSQLHAIAGFLYKLNKSTPLDEAKLFQLTNGMAIIVISNIVSRQVMHEGTAKELLRKRFNR